MDELQEIDVHIGPDGTVKVEVRGAKGRTCLDLTKEMEEYLGGQVERTYTDEFTMQPQKVAQNDRVHTKAGS